MPNKKLFIELWALALLSPDLLAGIYMHMAGIEDDADLPDDLSYGGMVDMILSHESAFSEDFGKALYLKLWRSISYIASIEAG